MIRLFGFGRSRRPSHTPAPKSLHLLRGPTMGTSWTAQFVAATNDVPGIDQQLQAAVDLVDTQMSTWKPSSDLSRFNAAAVGDWVSIPPALAFVVAQAIAIGRSTSGAFDITIGAQVNAWGFGPKGMTEVPLSNAPAAGMAALELRADHAALRKTAALTLDLSGIAKGYGVDLMADVLEHAGIADYLVTLDGELRCAGRKPGAAGRWTVGLDAPIPGEQRLWDVLEPAKGAMATSGDYRHFRILDGKALAHTIDPATGRPLQNGIASVTVFDQLCWRADAMATALMVLGPQKGVAVAQARDLDALFLLRDESGINEVVTGEFNTLCQRQHVM